MFPQTPWRWKSSLYMFNLFGSRQRNVRREVLVLQKVPLSSQAASHLSVGDGDGVHPWYMMLRRFSSRSARKWADLAARVKKVLAVLSIGFGSKEIGGACGPWVAFRVRLERALHRVQPRRIGQ